MKKFTELIASNSVAQAVLAILLGLFLTIWPQTTTITVVCLFAAAIGLSGAASLISYFRMKNKGARNDGILVTGLFLLVVALIIAIFPEAVAGLFSLFLGALLVLGGLINVVRSVGLREFGGSTWIVMLIVSALIALGGIVIIVNPFSTTVTFVLVLGVMLIAKGVIDLLIEFVFSRKA